MTDLELLTRFLALCLIAYALKKPAINRNFIFVNKATRKNRNQY